MAQDTKTNPQDQFRASLEDVLAVVEKLAGYCETTHQLIEVVRLGLDSEAQARILAEIVFGKQQRR